MAPDPQAIVAALPPWLQFGANAALFVLTVGLGVLAVLKGRKDAEAHPALDPAELLASSPVKTVVEAIALIAENMRLQTEALKVTSAAATALAKLIEHDFDERRVHREVDRRLEEERRRLDEERRRLDDLRARPPAGWGSPP